jgi:signal transduction histidine kinase
MGAHMLHGRERRRATRRSIRFTAAVITAIPILAGVAMWGFAGATVVAAVAGHAQPALHGTVLIRIALADAAGLVAVLIAAVATVLFARRLSRDVSSIEVTARRFADQQFPELVERLRRGDQVELDSELPAVAPVRTTELARAASAVASLQRAAMTAAATETSLRTGISQVFVSLARRNQSLLQRQLRMLDDLERKAAHPAALADLFPLDHLTTRMRRHAEGLIILSGSVPGRGWSSPVPVIDVIRGAIAEVEDYKRIAVATNSEDVVAGSAVADMIHLLAELIENAAMFSPSGTRVEVRADRVGNGFAFEIEDRGLGIKPEELDAINQRLDNPADFDLANADQLGLFVVGKLAVRHSVRVYLRPSPYGGTTAIVLAPSSMITPASETAVPAAPAGDQAPAAGGRRLQLALTGRPVPPAAETPSAAEGQPGGPGLPTLSGPPGNDRALPDIGEHAPEADRREPASPLGEPTFLGQSVRPSPADADQEAGTYRGLPRRVRQANLTPQLRDRPSPGPAAPARGPAVRSPDQARSLLASLQSGWERGRRSEEDPDPADGAGGGDRPDGGRDALQEDA